jgi:para-nitrobenzyl esterase
VTDTTVETRDGKLRGSHHDGIRVFRGIPYAAAPTGTRRFRPPEPAAAWTGVRDALRAGPVAPQPPSPLESLFNAAAPEWNEDCLSLNVWTPALDDGRRPVMVWIHGGAFVNGSGSTPWYDGTRFASRGDLVVVTINYRLGALGYLHLAPFDEERFRGAGNAGLLDQIAALEWVRDNIAAFGGDPGQVTVFGESAGGMSIGTLLGTPSAQGLFHRAIVQSGSASFVSSADVAAGIAERVLAKLDLSAASVDKIEDLPTEQILDAQTAVYDEEVRLRLPFQPVVDGVYLPRLPLDAVASGESGNVPLMIGTTAHEMTLFLVLDPSLANVDEPALLRRARGVFGDAADGVVRTYLEHHRDRPLTDVLVAMETDRVFRIPAIRLAEADVRAGRPVHMYLFAWETPAFGGLLRSCHALELPFMWDALDQGGVNVFTGDGAERHGLARDMHERWIAFARTGDPGWPGYDLEQRPVIVFDGSGSRVVNDPAGDERRLWDGTTQEDR